MPWRGLSKPPAEPVVKPYGCDFTKQEYSIFPSDFDEKTYCSAGYGRPHPVREGDIFELGGITLEVIELPGHTTGSIALLYREKKIL